MTRLLSLTDINGAECKWYKFRYAISPHSQLSFGIVCTSAHLLTVADTEYTAICTTHHANSTQHPLASGKAACRFPHCCLCMECTHRVDRAYLQELCRPVENISSHLRSATGHTKLPRYRADGRVLLFMGQQKLSVWTMMKRIQCHKKIRYAGEVEIFVVYT